MAELVAAPAAADLRLLRSRGRLPGLAALLGPAFVAAIAYVDPGNFATNFSAALCWRPGCRPQAAW
jgi:manganese transport protein